MKKTVSLLIDAFCNKRDFNDTPFSFDKDDIFFIDQGGGNYMTLIPSSKSMNKVEIDEIESTVNSHYTDGPDSSLKIASATMNHVNKRTIPFFVHSTENSLTNPIEWLRVLNQMFIYRPKKTLALNSPYTDVCSQKPFVQFARKLKEMCNVNKNPLKMEDLSSDVNKDSIEAIANDCIQYYCNEIEDSDSIKTKKFLMENTMLALLNHTSYVNHLNEQLAKDKQNTRRIFSPNLLNNKLEERE